MSIETPDKDTEILVETFGEIRRYDAVEKPLPELIVTRGGVPVKDQAAGVREFKEACRVAAAAQQDVKVAIADEAKNIVAGARRTAYGKPEQNFERIAHFWTAYAKAKGWPIEFTASDISPLMRLMKEARIVESPNHRDSHVDLVGYALTGAEVNKVPA